MSLKIFPPNYFGNNLYSWENTPACNNEKRLSVNSKISVKKSHMLPFLLTFNIKTKNSIVFYFKGQATETINWLKVKQHCYIKSNKKTKL